MQVFRSALLRFDSLGQALYDEDGLLAIAPDANGVERVVAAGSWDALAGEYATASAFLGLIGSGEVVSAVPGNHDAYVPGAAKRARKAWAAYMTADAGEADGWPYVRRRGDVAIVGVSSAVATGPFMATGSFSEKQEERLAAVLD